MSRLDASRSEESGWEVAAILIAMLPIGIIAVVLLLGLFGVNDNQGKMYIFSWSLGSLVICSPLAMICSAVGVRSRGGRGGGGAARLVAAGWILIALIISLLLLWSFVSPVFRR